MSTIQISALPAASAITADDLLPIEHDPSGTPVTQKATAAIFAAGVRGIAGAYVTTNIVPSGATSLTVNATQADVDVRIKGDTDAALVFLDAGTNRVGIGTATPTTLLDVSGTLKATTFTGSGASLTGILGTAASFQSLASDPASPTKGDVWYNTTSHLFKGAAVLPGAWTTQGSTTVARRTTGGTGTAGAAIVVGGYNDGAGAFYANVDIFNGSTWSSGAAYSSNIIGSNVRGTPTATINMSGYDDSGYYLTTAKTYNGTTWTAITSSSYPHRDGCCFGASSTSAGQVSGENLGNSRYTEIWNGSSWTTQGLQVTSGAVSNIGGGTVAAAFAAGGNSSLSVHETFNGTTWATATSLLVGVAQHAALGTTTSALLAGGNNGVNVAVATTQSFNGSSWSAMSTMNQARKFGMGGGPSSSSGMVAMGTVSYGVTTLSSSEVLVTPTATSVVTFTQT